MIFGSYDAEEGQVNTKANGTSFLGMNESGNSIQGIFDHLRDYRVKSLSLQVCSQEEIFSPNASFLYSKILGNGFYEDLSRV